MKYSKEEIKSSWDVLLANRGRLIAACVKSVSRSGMSRRIEYYVIGDGTMWRIGWYIARVLDIPYNTDKGGLQVTGGGMDMIFHVLSNLNYAALAYEKSIDDVYDEEKAVGRVYDDYLFNANNYFKI